MTRARMLLVPVLALLLFAAPVQAKIFVGPEQGIAISPTDVIGLSTSEDAGCTTADGYSGGNQVAVSHDRGATWAAGACLTNTNALTLDPVDGRVWALTITYGPDPGDPTTSRNHLYVVSLDAAGKVTGGRELADPDPGVSHTAAVSGGTLFIGAQNNRGLVGAVHSVAPDGAVGACGAVPSGTDGLLAMPGGVLLAHASDPDSELAGVSRDGCKTWVTTPKKL